LGGVLALGRISRSLPLRAVARTYVEFFRGFPLLLLIFFTFFALPRAGVQLSRYWSLVLALAAYNGAVLGEIFRAGILSLDRGQREAAVSIGLPYWPMMRIVILPQAFRRMTPTIVSQTVTLLKDTSLGFFIAYEELLRVGQIAGEFGGNALQTLTVVAAMYLVVNFMLSRLARHLEVRQRRRYRAKSIQVAGVEDLVAVGAGADVKSAA
jgi:glutamate transport system permease protein